MYPETNTPAQQNAIAGVGTAFSTPVTGAPPQPLTPQQQSAYEAVQKAFAPQPPPPATPPATPPPQQPAQPSTNLPQTPTTPTPRPLTEQEQELKTVQDEYQRIAQETQTTIKNIQNGTIPLTPGEQAEVDALKKQFDGLIEQQKLINTGASGVANIRGYQAGAGEYDPTFQAKTIGSIVSAGLAKVSDLEVKEAAAIAALTQSFKENNIAKVKDTWSIYKEASKERQDALQETIATAAKEIQKQQEQIIAQKEREIQASRDSAVADLMEKGITSPAQMLDLLNFDDSGRQIGDFTAKQIEETMKSLAAANASSVDKLTGDAANYVTLSKMGLLPKGMDLGQYLKWNYDLTHSNKAATVGNSPTGSGATSWEQFEAENLALGVIPVQLRNAATEAERYLKGIRLGLAAGLTPYQVADSLMGYKIYEQDEFSNGLRKYLAQVNLGSPEIANVARLINSGDYAGAITIVENAGLKTQKQNDPDSFMGEATPRYYAEKVAQIKQTIEDAGLMDAIGPIEGTVTDIFGRLPLTRRREGAKIQAQVTSLVAEMRNHLAGTAVTESERAFLEPLIASLSDKKGVFINKLDEISTNALTRYNNTRSAARLPELDEAQLLDKNMRVPLYWEGASDPYNNSIDAEEIVIDYGRKNPKARSQIEQMVLDGVPYDKILKALGI